MSNGRCPRTELTGVAGVAETAERTSGDVEDAAGRADAILAVAIPGAACTDRHEPRAVDAQPHHSVRA